jgi:type IV secretory pathway TraG/TraD family ATPase VirD4
LITQDLSQLTKAYSKDESILSNCHIRIAFAPNKIETAELLSKMSGASTVAHTQRNFSGSRLSVVLNNVSTNEQLSQRPLLTPDETMRLPPLMSWCLWPVTRQFTAKNHLLQGCSAGEKTDAGGCQMIGNAVIDARVQQRSKLTDRTT